MTESYPVFYRRVRKRCGKNTSRYFRMERLDCFLLLIDLQRAVEWQWKLPIAACSVSPLRCTTLNSFFKKRAAAGLTESIQHSLLDNSLLLFQEISFFKYEWFLHSTEVPFGFFASWSKTWYEYHWSARIKVLGLCAEVNKDAFSMNLQLGRERWAEQTIPDCLILANRDKWPSG